MAYIGSSPTKVVSRQSANIFTYTATANQTAFTGSDANGNTLACTPSDIMVHMNGLRLEESDYTASTTTVTLGSGAAVGDEVTITAFLTFERDAAVTNVADNVVDEANLKVSNTPTNGHFLSAQSGNTGGLTWANPPAGYADSDVDAHLLTAGVTLDATNDKVGIGTAAPLRQLSIASTASAEMSFISGTSSNASILFGDGTTGTDVYRGYIQYEHTNNAMTFATNAVERMRITSDGYIKMPYQPAFYMRNTTDGTRWKGGTVYVNKSNSWNNTTGVFTAPVAGAYQFGAFGQSNAGTFYCLVYQNGNVRGAFYDTDGDGYGHASFTVILDMAVNDTCYMQGASINTGGQNGCFGCFLG